jgi:hypothetical protein
VNLVRILRKSWGKVHTTSGRGPATRRQRPPKSARSQRVRGPLADKKIFQSPFLLFAKYFFLMPGLSSRGFRLSHRRFYLSTFDHDSLGCCMSRRGGSRGDIASILNCSGCKVSGIRPTTCLRCNRDGARTRKRSPRPSPGPNIEAMHPGAARCRALISSPPAITHIHVLNPAAPAQLYMSKLDLRRGRLVHSVLSSRIIEHGSMSR